MLQRLTINLSKPEQEALEKFAAIEIRDMRDQARFILRQELERLGFLKTDIEDRVGSTEHAKPSTN